MRFSRVYIVGAVASLVVAVFAGWTSRVMATDGVAKEVVDMRSGGSEAEISHSAPVSLPNLEQPQLILIEEPSEEGSRPEEVSKPEEFNVTCYEDVFSLQINKSYNIPPEFYYSTLPDTMYPLVEPVCALEKQYPISSTYLLAVAAVEVGWGKYFFEEGNNNWFNWSPDGADYQRFSSTEECVEYTKEAYTDRMFNPEWYAAFGNEVDNVFTIPEVNSRYAFYSDGSVNTYWGDLVGEIMFGMIEDYEEWNKELVHED